MSREHDDNAMEKMGYETFYRINDVKTFNDIVFNTIKEKLNLMFWVGGKANYVKSKSHRVTNKNKSQLIDARLRQTTKDGVKTIYLDDYFEKIDKFDYENELRTVLISKKPLISTHTPFIINIPDLIELCEF